MKTQRKLVSWPLLAVGVALPALLVAQWQVNTQVYRGGAPSTGSLRYGNTIQTQSVALPSQVRYAAWSSGATPSSMKMEYNRVGPLAPSGAIAYVPPAPNYHAGKPPTQGNYVDTRMTSGPPKTGWEGFSATSGSVRYSAPAPVQQVSTTPWTTFKPPTSIGLSPGESLYTPSAGSIKYSP